MKKLNQAFEFWNDPKEDIYTWKDGKKIKGTINIQWKKSPSIPVSEISRILINLRKNMKNSKELKKIKFIDAHIDGFITAVRTSLELRRRSREGINVSKNIRSIRKVDSSTKQCNAGVRHKRGSSRRHEKRCATSPNRDSKRKCSGSSSPNNARSSAHKTLKGNTHKGGRPNAKRFPYSECG